MLSLSLMAGVLCCWTVADWTSGNRLRAAPVPAAVLTPAVTPINCFPPLTLGSTVPPDASLGSQEGADCFAWSEFIALNWPQTGSNFGSPGDLSPVQWQGFMDAEFMYPSNGQVPPPWGSGDSVPSGCQTRQNLRLMAHHDLLVLRSASKFVPATADGSTLPPNTQQAFPKGGPAWLGAQNGTNVWYEVLVNHDIYDYVTQNHFYSASAQQAYVNNGSGPPVIFPEGGNQGITGAIEIKAAWMEVPDYNPALPGKWTRYKLSSAVVIGPTNTQCRSVTVALVGMHILHKTQSQKTWVWATFEQVDNVPIAGQVPGPYCCSFYSRQCTPRSVAVPNGSCLASGKPATVTVSCIANTPPPYYLGAGCPAPVPIQAERTAKLDSTAEAVTASVWSAILTQTPQSVFGNYELVDVLWSSNSGQNPTAPQKVPLNTPAQQAGNLAHVSNSTLETYIQGSKCTDCHRSANIAPVAVNSPWDSDFSFAIGAASVPSLAPSAKLLSRREAAKPARY